MIRQCVGIHAIHHLSLTTSALRYAPDHFITQEMCENPAVFFLFPDRFKTEEICIKALEVDPWQFKDVPNHFKKQEMCNNTATDYLFSWQFVPDWFITRERIDLLNDDDCVYNDHEMIEWYDGYKKRKAQKASIKEELLPVAWHPSRWWDWCVLEDEKKRQKNFGSNR